MNVADLISAERINCNLELGSKKRALEVLSELIATTPNAPPATVIFNKLINRERLGSTGLGHGVALPHARLSGETEPVAAFIKLRKGIDFDSFDKQPVDLLFALVVPEQSTEMHLQLLAHLAEMFRDPGFCQALRDSQTVEEAHRLLAAWNSVRTEP